MIASRVARAVPAARALSGARAAPRASTGRFAAAASYPSARDYSAQDDSGAQMGPIYARYALYKGKAALTFRPIAPTLVRVGGQSNGLVVQRAGTVMLEFAARDAPGADFDWQNKQLFALSATECGEVLEALDRNADVRLVHDPNASTPRAGQSIKTLRISPARDGGHFFSFQGNTQGPPQGGVQPYGANASGGGSVNIAIPVSAAEARTVKILFADLIPRLLAWDAVKPFLSDGDYGRGGKGPGNDMAPF